MEVGPSTVKAIHNFKGTNNDELCFKKGDAITVTQKVEGGWWEGTLNGVTGWFPSNYVKEMKLGDGLKSNKTSVGKLPESDVQVSSQDMEVYRAVVYKDILDTEANHIQEMNDITQKYLIPLKNSDCISDKDWAVLASNFEEVLETQKSLMAALENLKELSSKEQKIGGAFMQVAPQMKRVHLTYCSQHPKAVAIIEKQKESLNKFMEEHGSTTSILPLTTGLSSPFRRLEKYPALLQELQRHTEESNLDRGDTQRAFYVYRDISSLCQNKRRQKEMELEVMTGTIRGWEGEDIHSLGTIIHMGVVTVISEDLKKKDRHLVLFPNTLVILAVSSRLSAFIYKGKLSLSGIKVTKLEHDENTPHAFEITGNMIQRLVVSSHTKEDLDTWISFFKQYHHVCHSVTPPVVALRSIQNQHPSSSQVDSGNNNNSHVSQLQITLTPNAQQPPLPPHVTGGHNTVPKGSPKKVWTMWSLRPHPPIRTCPLVAKKDEVVMRRSANKKREKVMDEKAYEDDMRVLQVIEAYCNSAKTRYTVNSAMLDCPQVIIAEEEKIIVEDMKGNTSVVQEKTLVDTVYALKDQVKDLKEETANLARGLNEERKARKKLEEIVKKHLGGISREIFQGILED